MEFKVGDKVKFIGKVANHRVPGKDLQADIEKYNNRFTISRISTTGYVEFKENECWCIEFDEIELILEIQFTKSELKDGDIVTKRNGEKRTLVGKYLHDVKRASPLTYYTEDLKDAGGLKEHDIVKVERPVKYETVFERKEEILDEVEKRYLASVIRPFRKRVKSIAKKYFIGDEYIILFMKDSPNIRLPYFIEGTMYKEMEPDREYTLEELGL